MDAIQQAKQMASSGMMGTQPMQAGGMPQAQPQMPQPGAQPGDQAMHPEQAMQFMQALQTLATIGHQFISPIADQLLQALHNHKQTMQQPMTAQVQGPMPTPGPMGPQ